VSILIKHRTFKKLDKYNDNPVLTEVVDDKGEMSDIKIEKDINFNQDLFYGNPLSKKNPRKIGNTYAFLYKDGEPRVLIGPHWPFYVCLNSVIVAMVSTFYYFLWEYMSGIVSFFGIMIFLVQFTSYFLTFTINPGLPKKRGNNMKIQDLKNVRICGICNVVQDPQERIVHCFDCNICIEGYDHHCPWTSKCVGKNNLRMFYTFVATTMVLFGYLVFASGTSNRAFSG